MGTAQVINDPAFLKRERDEKTAWVASIQDRLAEYGLEIVPRRTFTVYHHAHPFTFGGDWKRPNRCVRCSWPRDHAVHVPEGGP